MGLKAQEKAKELGQKTKEKASEGWKKGSGWFG